MSEKGSSKLWQGALEWFGRLPSTWAGEVAVDVGRKRLRLAHPRVEALVRGLTRQVRSLELRGFQAHAQAYDARLTVSGWQLRLDVTLERLELAGGRYRVWLRTPGRVELEGSRTASALVGGLMGVGAGRAAVVGLVSRLLPPGLSWDGTTFSIAAALPPEGVLPARLFASTHLAVGAEHSAEGLWLAAEAWPGLVDLVQALLAADLPRTPPTPAAR